MISNPVVVFACAGEDLDFTAPEYVGMYLLEHEPPVFVHVQVFVDIVDHKKLTVVIDKQKDIDIIKALLGSSTSTHGEKFYAMWGSKQITGPKRK